MRKALGVNFSIWWCRISGVRVCRSGTSGNVGHSMFERLVHTTYQNLAKACAWPHLDKCLFATLEKDEVKNTANLVLKQPIWLQV